MDQKKIKMGSSNLRMEARRLFAPTTSAISKNAADEIQNLVHELQSWLTVIRESTTDSIIGTTPDGIILNWNRGAETMYGYPAAEVVGRPISILVPPRYADEASWLGERITKGERIDHYGTIRMRKDGTLVEVSLTICPVKDAKGSVVGISYSGRDLSRPKRTEERLREYQKVVEGSQDMIAVVDRNYHYLLANNAFLQYRGMDREEVVGRSAEDVLGRDVFNRIVKKYLDTCFQGKTVRYEMKYTYPGLGERDLSVAYFPIEDTGTVNRVATVIRDITERRKAEGALRQSEEMFRLTFDQSPIGAALLDAKKGHFSRVNKAFCRFIGYTEEELAHFTFADITHPDDKAMSLEQTRLLLTGQIDGFEMEKRYLCKDGSIAWGHVSVQAVKDESGRILHTLAMTQDITKRKQAYLDLRDSEEAMKSLLNATADAAFLMDVEGIVIAANDVLAQPLGRQVDDVIGRNIFDMFPKDAARYRSSWAQKVIESGKPVRLEDSSLSGRYFDTSLYPVFDTEGRVVRLAVYAKDVTEIKHASQALAESEAKFRRLFDSVSDGITLRDARTYELLDANRKFCEMWGYTLEELKAMPLGGLGSQEPIDQRRARLIDYYDQIAKGIPNLYVWAAKRKDGSTFWVELNGAQISIGTRECLLLVVRDVTERKLAEEKIRASLREKEVLLKEIHHRVKNNLQIVSSLLYLQTMRTEHPGAVSALRESQARVKSMALIHEKLYRSPNLASIDMGSYTKSLVSDLQNSLRIEGNSVRVTLNVDDIPLGISDAIPCGLIINELVSNALKHAFPNGKEGEITIQLLRGASTRITLTVSDNGIGIPDHVEFPNSASLGLTLVKSLVEQLDGTIELDRRAGTTFTITFG